MRLPALLLALWLAPFQAGAAVLETDVTPEMAEMGCTARLSGPIETGDLDRIQPFLTTRLGGDFGAPDFDQDIVFRRFAPAVDYAPDAIFTHRLCLNSAGGSLIEALRIADFLHRAATDASGGPAGIQTAIARGDRCDSACALVFLAGRFVRFSGNPAYEGRSNHLLHPLGHLTFSGPFISLSEQSYSADTARRIWQVGMEAAARIAGAIASGAVFMTDDLYSESLTHPPGDPLVLETVGQALRWGIDVEPNVLNQGRYPYSQDRFHEALCLNAAAAAPRHVDLQRTSGDLSFRREGGDLRSTGAFVDALSGRGYDCAFETDAWDRMQDWLGNGPVGSGVIPRLRFSCFSARVTLAAQEECYDCDMQIDLACMGVLPPDLPLTEIYVDPSETALDDAQQTLPQGQGREGQ